MAIFPLIISVLGLLVPICILAIIFGYQNRSEARFHETLQRVIESGQTLDEELLSGIPGYKKVMPRDDVRSGLITTAVGLGLILLGYSALGSKVYGAGYLVFCIGLAIFGYGVYMKQNNPALEQMD
jgi:ABC-type transport system involved in multi-copper enzyme maturation permease subunit